MIAEADIGRCNGAKLLEEREQRRAAHLQTHTRHIPIHKIAGDEDERWTMSLEAWKESRRNPLMYVGEDGETRSGWNMVDRSNDGVCLLSSWVAQLPTFYL